MSASKSYSPLKELSNTLVKKKRDFRCSYSGKVKSGDSKRPQPEPLLRRHVNKPNLREEFIKALKVSDKSDRTVKTYCDAVKMFQTFIHKNPLHVTENDIRAFFFI